MSGAAPPPMGGGSPAWEMISGPDLGAGFLHQLTRERAGRQVTFGYHAQPGGADASGPPKGSPEPLGWWRSDRMCPIGGRVCWHRRFELPDSESALVRSAYQRMRFVLATMIDQVYEGVAVPFEAGLAETFDRLTAAPDAPPIRWAVTGAAADWLVGPDVPVRSIDLATDGPGVGLVAARLREFLIEPPGPSESPTGWARGGAAFVGTPQAGVLVRWTEAAPEASSGATRRLRWSDRDVPVAPGRVPGGTGTSRAR